MKFTEIKGIYSISKIVEYISSNDEKVMVVCPEYSPQTFYSYFVERITGVRILDIENKDEKIKFLRDNESLINMYVRNNEGDDKFLFLSDKYKDEKCLVKNILNAIASKNVNTIILNEYKYYTTKEQREYIGHWLSSLTKLYGVQFIKTGDGYTPSKNK